VESGKGCLLIGVGGGGFAFILALLLLFAMASGSSGSTGTGGVLNTSKVPGAYVSWVEEAGGECEQVSAPLIAAQIQQESDWDPNAVSNTGAEGIAQFEPGTWATWGVDANGDGTASAFDPADGIVAMGRYDCALAQLVKNVPGDAVANMLAAYNAGPGAVIQYGGIPPFAQTQDYVKVILAGIVAFALDLPATGATATGADAFATAEIAAAEKWVGTPYVYGGGDASGPTTGLSGSTSGFDCSGLVLYAVYQASHGAITLPHSSEQDALLGTTVPRADLQPGDVIAIQVVPGDYSHIVIYLGGGMIVEAPRTGENVKIAPLTDFGNDVMTIRRFG
jgi:cell wall-associated NlpC family hydrolase